ncbi:2867_t:CDS:10 [Paraglomus occultum]|uniref:2867_t:CDS:1 n=1 Tax=Paraglomus occultum TaxID=144539 RepID=A0A9N8ZCM2_9GLOM|nr:2867_t:CDS:10 [Paraglomus occultum]
MFASWTAWFAPKVDKQARELWVHHGGKHDIHPSRCNLFFSNDKNEPETRRLLQQETVVIYHPSWITDCHNRGRKVHLGPFVLPDFDIPIRRRIQAHVSLPNSPNSPPVLTSTSSSPTPAPTYTRNNSSTSGRYSLPMNVTLERLASLSYVDDLDPEYGIPRQRARKVRSSDVSFMDFSSINGSASASVIENEEVIDDMDANATESKLPEYFYRQDGWNNGPPPSPTPPQPTSRASRSPLRKKRRLDSPEVFRRDECEHERVSAVENLNFGNSIGNAMDNEQETVNCNVENHVEEIINEGHEDDVIEDQRNSRSKRATPTRSESLHPMPYPNSPTPSRFHTPPTPTPQPSTISANQLKQRATVLLMALNPSRTSIFEAVEILRPGFVEPIAFHEKSYITRKCRPLPANNATTLAEAVRILDTENPIEFLRGEEDLQLDEADFKILRDDEIAGREIEDPVIHKLEDTNEALMQCVKELRLGLKNLGGLAPDSNEAVRCEFISPILHASVNLLEGLILAPQFEVVGDETTGRVDYTVKKLLDSLREEIMCITESKPHQVAIGFYFRLRARVKRISGNVRHFRLIRLHVWDCNYSEKDYLISFKKSALDNEDEFRRNVKRLMEVIVGLLEDRAGAVNEEPLAKKRRVGNIFNK